MSDTVGGHNPRDRTAGPDLGDRGDSPPGGSPSTRPSRDDDDDQQVSRRRLPLIGFRASPPVFLISAGLIIAFVVFVAVTPTTAETTFEAVQDWITTNLDWFYISIMLGFFLFVIALAVSPYGRLRLGPDDEPPKYGRLTWFAMLFSAGIGIGMVFFSVAEPLTHLDAAPTGVTDVDQAAQQAMNWTLLHWGFHGWGVYALVGLSLAYAAYRRGMPMALRSAFHPLLGDRIYGPVGHAIDVFAVLGTMFGVAASLGLGAQQIMAGLEHEFGLPTSTAIEIWFIAGITAVAVVSVALGLHRGIRRLSVLAMWLAGALFALVLFMGPTLSLLGGFVGDVGYYLRYLPWAATATGATVDAQWQADWTLFYWGWWIAWSPFVGVFIARVSRGRTIREFVLGVLFVPTIVIFLWFSVFGNTGLRHALAGETQLVDAAVENFPVTIFVLFDRLPLSLLLTVIALGVLVAWFVTSSDSASLVIDMLTAGGIQDPPTRQRIFWAIAEGAVAAMLLLAGGLHAIQAFQVTTGLPLAVVLIVMAVSLLKGLHNDRRSITAEPAAASSASARADTPGRSRPSHPGTR